jgi:peptide/nickel transport system permease protein
LTRESGGREFRKQLYYSLRHNPMVLLGLVIVVLWVGMGILAPALAPYDPMIQGVDRRLEAPNNIFLFGTDELGRDVLSRVLYGAQITIPAGLAVIIFGSILGVIVGAIAGYAGGLWDEILMRITELFMAFPTIILALAITAALGPDIRNAILALVLVWWPGYARLIRGLVIEVKSKDYVDGARSVGAKDIYILLQTILPNCVSPAIVMATLDIGNAILTFAGLSFLGLGPDPSSPEWGRMVSIGIDFFDQWWMWLFPGMAIAILVLAFNFVGDGLRDFFDPRLRK